jgi:hypothetical protein
MIKTSKIGQLKKIISFDFNYSFLFLCLHDRLSSYTGEEAFNPPKRALITSKHKISSRFKNILGVIFADPDPQT